MTDAAETESANAARERTEKRMVYIRENRGERKREGKRAINSTSNSEGDQRRAGTSSKFVVFMDSTAEGIAHVQGKRGMRDGSVLQIAATCERSSETVLDGTKLVGRGDARISTWNIFFESRGQTLSTAFDFRAC